MTRTQRRSKNPQIFTAFGASPRDAFLLGSASDDATQGLLFRLDGKVARRIGTLEHPCRQVVSGSDGLHYGVLGTNVVRFRGSVHEVLRGPTRTRELGPIWCGPGARERDVLMVGTADHGFLYRRDEGAWRRVPLPSSATILNSVSGRTAKELFVCTGEGVLRLHRGRAGVLLSNEVDERDLRWLDDEPGCVVPLDDGRLLVIGERLHLWQSGRKLKSIKSPADGNHCAAAQRLGAAVYVSSSVGVVRYQDGRAKRVSDFPCNALERLGSGLLAGGYDGGAMAWDGARWSAITFS